MGGLCTLHFLNLMSEKIGKNQLFKKSILLLKSWFTYDASLLGSQHACMATYALYVLILTLLNNFYDELETPMDVFRKFFEVWGDFDWFSNIITVYSPISNFNFYETLKEQVSMVLDNRYSITLTQTHMLCMREVRIQTIRIDLCYLLLQIWKKQYLNSPKSDSQMPLQLQICQRRLSI